MKYSELRPNDQFFKLLDMNAARDNPQMKLHLYQKLDSTKYRHFFAQEHVYTVTDDFAVIVAGCDGK
jgi:hypothetical protein